LPDKVRIEISAARRTTTGTIAKRSRRSGAAAEAGGGAVFWGRAYHLDRPSCCCADGVVIRGQGAEKTTIVFRL